MARWIMGWEFTSRSAAHATAENVSYGGRAPVIIRLRDRTGPSLRERVAALEADLLDLRTRIGDLEREPAPVRPEPADESPISEAARNGPLGLDLVPADPDRFAEKPEPTDAGLARMVRSMTEALKSDAEIGRALYNLGREHGRADADAALDLLRGKLEDMRVRAEKAEAERMFVCPDGTGCVLVPVPEEPIAALRDPLADPQPGDWFFDTHDREVVEVVEVHGDEIVGICVHVMMHPTMGSRFQTVYKSVEWRTAPDEFGRRPMTPAEVAAFKRDGTRPDCEED